MCVWRLALSFNVSPKTKIIKWVSVAACHILLERRLDRSQTRKNQPMEDLKKRKLDEAGNGDFSSKEELRLLLDPLAKSQLVDLLAKLYVSKLCNPSACPILARFLSSGLTSAPIISPVCLNRNRRKIEMKGKKKMYILFKSLCFIFLLLLFSHRVSHPKCDWADGSG